MSTAQETLAAEIKQQNAVIQELFKDNADAITKVREDLMKAQFDAYKMRTKESKPALKKRQEIVKNVPRFWFISMLNCGNLSPLINVVDHEILNQLKDVWIDHDDEDPRNIDITFTFGPNEYFEEESLTKKIRVTEQVKDDSLAYVKYDLDIPVSGDSVKITWKSDEKNLLKKAPHLDVDDLEEYDEFTAMGSFFHFFASDKDPSETSEALHDWWHSAIEWYSNFMHNDDEDEEDEEDEDEEDDDPEREIDLEAESDGEKPPAKKQKSDDA